MYILTAGGMDLVFLYVNTLSSVYRYIGLPVGRFVFLHSVCNGVT